MLLNLVPRENIYINGRFLAAPLTGVQRVCYELTKGLDRQLQNSDAPERPWRLLVPERTVSPELKIIETKTVEGGSGVFWEQTRLAHAAKDGYLLNFANTGPLNHRRSIVMLHDAQVRDTPASYSAAFALWYRLHQPILAKRALSVLTVSEYSKERLAHYNIAPSEKIHVIPNGCDHFYTSESDYNSSHRDPTKEAPDLPPYCVAVSSPLPHKNIRLLLEAFEDPRLASIDLKLIGAPLPAGKSPPTNVKHLGRVTDEAMTSLFKGALCVLLPSKTEGFGLTALEAMINHAPVIAARAGALPETCGDAATLLDPNDERAWSDAILDLHTNPGKRDEMIELGSQRVKQFSWDQAATKVLGIVNGLTENTGSA
ncbi:MAG: glycosyltransferase family 1 protein [Pseudomonadota bacterium]